MAELHDGIDFFFGKGGGAVPDADEGGDTRGGSDDQPGIVVKNHANKNVAGENFLFNLFLFTSFNSDCVASGDDNVKDSPGNFHGFDSLLNGSGNFVFVAGIGVKDIPFGIFGNGLIDFHFFRA